MRSPRMEKSPEKARWPQEGVAEKNKKMENTRKRALKVMRGRVNRQEEEDYRKTRGRLREDEEDYARPRQQDRGTAKAHDRKQRTGRLRGYEASERRKSRRREEEVDED